MKHHRGALWRIWTFYYEGFRGMTWGRQLWLLILIKLIILFLILRLFFFRPHLEGMTQKERIEHVGNALTPKGQDNN